MTVSTIATLASNVNRALGANNPKLASSINSLFASSSGNSSFAKLTDTISLQSQVTSLRVASRNIAQADTLVSIASGGADEIDAVLGQLADLASRAGSVSEGDLAQFNTQFQSLRQQINRIVSSTQFDNQSLLDGSPSTLNTGADGEQILGGLTEKDLFGGADVNLRTANDVKQAQAAIAKAQAYVAAQQKTLTDLGTGLQTATAAIQSALQNQDASKSTLDDTDFTEALFGNAPGTAADQLTSDINKALGAQVKRIPPSLIELLD